MDYPMNKPSIHSNADDADTLLMRVKPNKSENSLGTVP